MESVTSGGITTSYVYDQNGNITEIKRNGVTVESYTYDSLNQLKTVTRNGVTTEYTYSNGNITEVKQNGVTVKIYAYGNSNWRDLLTAYNGQAITYYESGTKYSVVYGNILCTLSYLMNNTLLNLCYRITKIIYISYFALK